MEEKKKLVKIAYHFSTSSETKGGRNSEGTYHYIKSETKCYGLYSNVESLDMMLQDYELFIDIENKYRPKEHESGNSGPLYTLDDDDEGHSYYSYNDINNKFVYELNEALSERIGIEFVAADRHENLPYFFYKSINGYDGFEEFENERKKAIDSIKSEIFEISRKIDELERRRDLLKEESHVKEECSLAVRDSLLKLIEQGKLNINEKIPHIDMYPIQTSIRSHEPYEFMLMHGAIDDSSINPLEFLSWYGFFKKYSTTSKLYESDLDLVIMMLPKFTDEDLFTLFIAENPKMEFKGLLLNEDYIMGFRKYFLDCYDGFECDDHMRRIIRVWIGQKRYRAIEIIDEFSNCDPFPLGFDFFSKPTIFFSYDVYQECVKLKDLEALKALNSVVGDKFYEKYSDFAKKYCNEENLGKEMMDYLREHERIVNYGWR